ncbi:MAG: hypothetical protein MRJ68_09195 [Nitrospira sp.]|nr:hypothetical protein [Nitrospira sp.]
MKRIFCNLMVLCAVLLTSGCEIKLFTNRVNIECATDDPPKATRGGKFVNQSDLPSKPLQKKQSSPGAPTAKKSLLEQDSSGTPSRTRFVMPVQNPSDDYCRTDDEEVDAIAQSTDVWCWAASAETVMKYHSTSPNKSQCNIVNTTFRGEGDPSGPDSQAFCCADKYHNNCQRNGLPSWAFDAYEFSWLMVKGPLEREKIAAQLCSNGPFIFILRYAGGGGHSFVVGDYDYDPDTEEMALWVYDHSPLSTDPNTSEPSPTSYLRWTYQDYVEGQWGGEIHEHDVNYVYITPSMER